MTDHIDDEGPDSLWRKLLRSKPTEGKRVDLDAFKREEERKSNEKLKTVMLVGNMQIEHVTPQFTAEDARAGFETQEYQQRCRWMHKFPAIEGSLRKCLENGRAFYLVGESGCGKSVFSKALARQFILNGGDQVLMDKHFLKYVNFGKMMDGIKANTFANQDFILREVMTCTILFLDDIGSERNREHSEDVLFKILDTRLFAKTRDGQPFRTFFSSNFLVNDLPYNERILRRIRDMAKEVVVAPVHKPQTTPPPSGGLNGNPTYS